MGGVCNGRFSRSIHSYEKLLKIGDLQYSRHKLTGMAEDFWDKEHALSQASKDHCGASKEIPGTFIF
jgi:hypothetical protein